MGLTPDYLICLECETPCYGFEWRDDKPLEALCLICGNDDLEQFLTEDELETLAGGMDTAEAGHK
jgi:hypothetical protein